jgi:hypothetical protein
MLKNLTHIWGGTEYEMFRTVSFSSTLQDSHILYTTVHSPN